MDTPQLPVCDEHGLWPKDFSELVDAYKDFHGIPRAEVFRRISEVTGNSVNGLSLRYHGHTGS